MFGLTYLPEADVKRQLELQDELKECRDIKRQEAAQKELAELNAKRKPIINCNIEETTELKGILYKKLELVMSTGKRTQAAQFMKMIKIIDERILVLNLEMRKEAQEKTKKKLEDKEARKEEAKEVTRGVKRGKGPPRARSGKSRWTFGIDKID